MEGKFRSIGSIILGMILVILTACSDSAGNNRSGNGRPLEGPRLVLETSFIDAGQHASGEEIMRSIRFSNAGTEDLLLGRAMGIGSGITVSCPEKPVKPGESGEITIRIRTQGRSGLEERRVVIQSNDPVEPRQSITITMDLDLQIGLQPRRLWFGNVTGSGRIKREIEIVGSEISRLDPDAIVADAGTYNASVSFTKTDARDSGRPAIIIGAELDTVGLPPGPFNIPVVIRTGFPDIPTLETFLTGELAGPFVFDPPRLYFGQFVPGEVYSRPVTIRRQDGVPFRILDAVMDNPLFSVAGWSADAAAGHSLSVMFHPNESAENRYRVNLSIETDASDCKRAIFQVYAFRKTGKP